MRRFARFGAALPALAAAWSWAGPALAQQSRPDYYQYGPHMMWGGGYGWFIGPIMWLLFIAIAVIVVVLLVRWLGVSGGPAASAPGKTSLDILKERFAKGEIDKKEFEERRKVLEQ
ncbi:MAG: SHOCT domain-containing protein [Hyphomicrobiales bacterium]|nr:SHOCT domain-containing protein [Hyphomicrobiales bacterium]